MSILPLTEFEKPHYPWQYPIAMSLRPEYYLHRGQTRLFFFFFASRQQPGSCLCKWRDFSMIKFLGEMQCDLEFTDTFCETPLTQAANGGHVSAVQYLLENQSQPKSWRIWWKEQATAHFSCRSRGNPMVVDCLLKHGADMDYRILDDSSLWLAMEHKRIAVVSFLVEQ